MQHWCHLELLFFLEDRASHQGLKAECIGDVTACTCTRREHGRLLFVLTCTCDPLLSCWSWGYTAATTRAQHALIDTLAVPLALRALSFVAGFEFMRLSAFLGGERGGTLVLHGSTLHQAGIYACMA